MLKLKGPWPLPDIISLHISYVYIKSNMTDFLYTEGVLYSYMLNKNTLCVKKLKAACKQAGAAKTLISAEAKKLLFKK